MEDPTTEGEKGREREREGEGVQSGRSLICGRSSANEIYTSAVLQNPRVYRNARKAA